MTTRQLACADIGRVFTLATIFFIPIATSLVAICFHLAILFSLLSGNWQQKWSELRKNPIVLLFCAFCILFVVGAVYSSAPGEEIKATLLRSGKYFLAIFLFPLFTETRWRYYALYAFVASMTVVLLLMYANQLDFLFDLNFAQYADTGRLFKHSINTGFLMVVFVYLLMLLILKAERPRWLWASLFILAMANLLIFSTSRTGYVLLFALTLLLGWQVGRWRGLGAMLILSSIMLLLTYQFSPVVKQRVNSVTQEITQYQESGKNTSTGGRLQLYKNSWALIKAHPIFGTGSGSFASEYRAIDPDERYHFHHPHNDYIYMAVELGIFGVLMILMLYAGVWKASFTLATPQREWVQAIVLAMAVGSVFNCFLLESVQRYLFTIFMVVAFANYKPLKKPV